MWSIVYVSIALYFGYKYGKRRGEQEMYRLCKDAEQVQREFFSQISLK